jgi:membrane protein
LTTPERPGRGAAAVAALKGVLKDIFTRNKALELNDVAAGLSFWAIVSMFPAVLAFASLLGSIEVFIGSAAADELRRQITDFLNRTLPPDSEITSTVTNIIQQSRAGIAIIALLSAGWGMSKGFAGLCRGLALVDGQPGARYGIKGRLIGLLLGLATLLIMTVVLLQIVVGPLLGFEKLLPGTSTLLTVWNALRWPVLVVLVIAWLTTLLQIGPGPRPGVRWRDRLPGAMFTAGAWVAVTFGFKLYVSVIGGANPILGVLGAAIVSLTWLYLLALTTLLGAALNAALIDRRKPVVDVASRAAANGFAANGSPPTDRAAAPASSAVGAGMVAAALLFGRRER